jgi:hypothetical protein
VTKQFSLFVMSLALLLLGLFALLTRAEAADLNVSWTNPVTNVDGSAIPATGPGSLTGTRVEHGTCSGAAFGVKEGERVAPAGVTSLTILNVAPGTTCVRAFARNTYGNESAASSVQSKVIPTPVPNPPVLAVPVIAGMSVTPVYSVASNGSRSTFVGFTDVGATCTGPVLFTYRSKKFREVARADVDLWGATSLKLAAPCA